MWNDVARSPRRCLYDNSLTLSVWSFPGVEALVRLIITPVEVDGFPIRIPVPAGPAMLPIILVNVHLLGRQLL
jgi:hypothetical protein